jgi:hypothetical protein
MLRMDPWREEGDIRTAGMQEMRVREYDVESVDDTAAVACECNVLYP